MARRETKRKKVEKVGWYDGVEMPIDRLHKQIEREVLNRTLKRDEDGDWPVDVRLVDRTRFHRMRYQPVPYTHDRSAMGAVDGVAMKDLEEAERVAATNLEIAMDEFRRVRRDVIERRRVEAGEVEGAGKLVI